jgi:hypothetical protein
MLYRLRFPLLSPVLLVLLTACATEGVRQPVAGAPAGPDFGGAWELDIAQSDNLQARLQVLVRDLQRAAERRAQGLGDRPAASGGLGARGEAIVGLARLADYVSQSQLLDVKHNAAEIDVRRERDFTLHCEFHDRGGYSTANALGRELCGWDGHQLLFHVFLPDGVRVQYRLSLAPEGQRLHIATTVASASVPRPFTLNRVYNRYDPGSDGIRCEQTLSRGRVCTTEAQ